MKIYSTTSEYDITDFLGQDVWVLCNTTFAGNAYIRPISINGSELLANYIETNSLYEIFEHPVLYVEDYFDTWTTETDYFNISDIEVCTPLEVCNNNDIKDYFGI